MANSSQENGCKNIICEISEPHGSSASKEEKIVEKKLLYAKEKEKQIWRKLNFYFFNGWKPSLTIFTQQTFDHL